MREAQAIFHVADSTAVWYSRGPPPHDPRNVMHLIETALSKSMCKGHRPFDAKNQVRFELVAVSADGPAKIFIGDSWVSDGRIVSQLPETAYADIAGYLRMRALQGGSQSRAAFEAKLEEDYSQFLTRESDTTATQSSRNNSTQPNCR